MTYFSLILGLGASIGLAWVTRLTLRGLGSEHTRFQLAIQRLDVGLLALAGATLGARLANVAVSWSYYQAHPMEILAIWEGGISWTGALPGAGLALFLWAMATRQIKALPTLTDALLPLLLTVSLATWMACWQSGSAYGPAAPGAWWALPTRDEWGVVAGRLPLQPIAAILTLALFALIERINPRHLIPGQRSGLALLGVSGLMLASSLFRVDPSPLWFGLRADTWAAFFHLTVSILICGLTFFLQTKMMRIKDLPKTAPHEKSEVMSLFKQ